MLATPTPNKTSAKSKSALAEKVGVIADADKKQINLPGDILSDLQDAFQMYDPENVGLISPGDFRVILSNFGF